MVLKGLRKGAVYQKKGGRKEKIAEICSSIGKRTIESICRVRRFCKVKTLMAKTDRRGLNARKFTVHISIALFKRPIHWSQPPLRENF